MNHNSKSISTGINISKVLGYLLPQQFKNFAQSLSVITNGQCPEKESSSNNGDGRWDALTRLVTDTRTNGARSNTDRIVTLSQSHLSLYWHLIPSAIWERVFLHFLPSNVTFLVLYPSQKLLIFFLFSFQARCVFCFMVILQIHPRRHAYSKKKLGLRLMSKLSYASFPIQTQLVQSKNE